jgi:2-C-methyl-D-erythritol 4-phosphate cytidylyltransferase
VAGVGAIIVAAGRSERMGGLDKLLQLLGGRPVLAHSLATFAQHPEIEAIVVVTSETNLATVRELVAAAAPGSQVVLGGARRRDSVLAGLNALPTGIEYVLVHDGARPLVTHDLIDAALAGARETGAAVCAVPVNDTVKRADEHGLVRSTVSRQGLWLVQTPQAFHVDLLREAHAFSDLEATDDAALVELMDAPVRLVQGSARNIKITTPEDLRFAEALLVFSP